MVTTADVIRALLSDSSFDPSSWPEAHKYFVYTWNRVCSKLLSKTPFELYDGQKPSIRHHRFFGAVAYINVPSKKRSKVEAKARHEYLEGYVFRTEGYRIWLPEPKEIIESSNVTFDESRCSPERSGALH